MSATPAKSTNTKTTAVTATPSTQTKASQQSQSQAKAVNLDETPPVKKSKIKSQSVPPKKNANSNAGFFDLTGDEDENVTKNDNAGGSVNTSTTDSNAVDSQFSLKKWGTRKKSY